MILQRQYCSQPSIPKVENWWPLTFEQTQQAGLLLGCSCYTHWRVLIACLTGMPVLGNKPGVHSDTVFLWSGCGGCNRAGRTDRSEGSVCLLESLLVKIGATRMLTAAHGIASIHAFLYVSASWASSGKLPSIMDAVSHGIEGMACIQLSLPKNRWSLSIPSFRKRYKVGPQQADSSTLIVKDAF